MSIKEVTMYTVKCDGCGKEASEEEDGYSWMTPKIAHAEALLQDWIEQESKHYCTDCIEWGEDELVPKTGVQS